MAHTKPARDPPLGGVSLHLYAFVIPFFIFFTSLRSFSGTNLRPPASSFVIERRVASYNNEEAGGRKFVPEKERKEVKKMKKGMTIK